jgi:hypothetical protein
VNFRGPLLNADGEPLRCWATTFPGDERVEVELRAGRNGIVSAVLVADVEPVEAPELPPNEAMRPVPPEARTTPFSVGDFGPPRPPLSPEEEAELEGSDAEVEELISPDAPRPDGRALDAARVAGGAPGA